MNPSGASLRDKLVLYINGKRHEIAGDLAFAPVTDYLRYHLHLTGTKVVCAEGDCGACTLLIGRPEDQELSYQAVNGCIQYMYQLDGTHVVTLEGMTPAGSVNAVQEAMIACNGAQCGYCTPGIVMAMCGFFDTKPDTQPASPKDIQDTLTGNLCRCTGYEAILKAGTQVSLNAQPKLRELYPAASIIEDLEALKRQPACVQGSTQQVFLPTSLADAVRLKAAHPKAVIVSGGTDVHVVCNKRHTEPQTVISLANVAGLQGITIEDGFVSIGAKVSLAKLEQQLGDIFPEFTQMLERFGSPQIKHAGTLAGNIANGSPIGDSLPFLFVMDAEVEALGPAGTRLINFNSLYTGYRQLALAEDELIQRIRIPLPSPTESRKLYKISRRQHLDISTFTAALRVELDGPTIRWAKLAYGGVGPVVLRLPKTEAFLTGKPLTEALVKEAGQIAAAEISPISDVRGHRDYRLALAENILQKWYWELMDHTEGVLK